VVADIAIEIEVIQKKSGIKGRKKPILFRRGSESAKAFVPKEVFLSQRANRVRPGRQMMKSSVVICSVSWLIISIAFIGIIFFSLESGAFLY